MCAPAAGARRQASRRGPRSCSCSRRWTSAPWRASKGMSVAILSAARGRPLAGAAAPRHHAGSAPRLGRLRLAAGAAEAAAAGTRWIDRGLGGRARGAPRSAPGELVPGLLASPARRSGATRPPRVTPPTRPWPRDATVAWRRSRSAPRRRSRHAPAACWRDGRWWWSTVPPGSQGRHALQQLTGSRAPAELLIVVQSDPPPRARRACSGSAPRASPAPSQGELTSSDTQERGLLSERRHRAHDPRARAPALPASRPGKSRPRAGRPRRRSG